MKPFQGGVFVVAVTGGVRDVFVFKILDEVDGKEAFADTALAVEDEDEPFNHIVHRVLGVQLSRYAGHVFLRAHWESVRVRQP